MSEVNPSEAHRHAQQAKASLQRAAEALGYDDIHEIMLDDAGELPEGVDDHALEGLTNAYSWLDNGSLNSLK